MKNSNANQAHRVGEHVIKLAQQLGWQPSQAEGAWEYVSRKTYETALEDLADGRMMAKMHYTQYLLTKDNKE